jgi:hypothetical protein
VPPLSGYRVLACENTREVLEEVGLPEVEIGHLVWDGLPG